MKKALLGVVLLLSGIGVAFAADNQAATSPATTITKSATLPLAATDILIKSPAIQLMQNNPNTAQVFMNINNKSDKTISVIAVNSMTSNQALLQKTHERGDKQITRKINKIILQPNTDTVLKPDGIQVTLLGLKQTLHKGDSVPVLLIFDDGSSLTVRATVG